MKIILDPQIFIAQKYGGISRYYNEIFSRLKKKNIDIDIPLFSTNNVYFIKSNLITTAQIKAIKFLKIISFLKISLRKFEFNQNKKIFSKSLKKNNFDLFIPTYYDISFLKLLNEKPFVLTIYDMIHELYPMYFFNDQSTVKNKLILIEKADKIIAVSENTKKDILKIYPHIEEKKIHVIYHGNSIKINSKNSSDLPKKYILFVGERQNYKNFVFMVQALSDILLEDSDLYLISAGSSKFDEFENNLINNLGLEKQILQKNFNDCDLGLFYKNAQCFVFPSMYEGFGIPILESMACGCPVVLTNSSSFPEVAQEAGIYFEVNNAKDLSQKVNELIKNENLRNEYILKGLKQSKKFSWEKASKQCLEVYTNAILESKFKK